MTNAAHLALADFDRAIRLDGSNGDALSGRGSARVLLGQHRTAVADAEASLRHGAADAQTYYLAGRIYARAALAAANEVRQAGRAAVALTASYQDRAVTLIGEAVRRTPPGQRAAFVRDQVFTDPALRPILRRLRFERFDRPHGGFDPLSLAWGDIKGPRRGELAMFRHRPSRLPDTITTPQRSSRPWPRPGRRWCCLGVARLEDRTLLSADDGFGHDLAHATDIILTGSESATLTGTFGPIDTGAGPSADVFRIRPSETGRLYAKVHPQGPATRLSLLDDRGRRLLIQSDGRSRDDPDDLVDLHVPAGTVYLVVEGQGGAGSYVLTTRFTPSAPPSLPLRMKGPGVGFSSLTLGDFNGDGVSDIAGPDGIHLGVGDGTFRDPSAGLGIPRDALYLGPMISGDFNGDGRLDLAVSDIPSAATGSGDIAVLLGNGDGTFRDPRRFGAGIDPASLVAGDFNGDHQVDLATANWGSDDIAVLLGNGDGSFQDPRRFGAGINPASLVVGDFNGDGRPDLATANLDSGDIAVLLGNGDGSFQDPRRLGAGAYPASLVAGDFNGDHQVDLATANWGSDDIAVLLGNGDGSFQDPRRFGAGISPNTVEIGASHGLLLSWVWEPTRYQGGCDYDATRTMHAAARCDGPVLGSIDGTGTDYPARGRSPSACGHRPNQSTPLYADPRSRLLGGAGHGNLDRAADPPSLQARTPASLRRGDPSSVQPVRGPTTSGHRPGPPPV